MRFRRIIRWTLDHSFLMGWRFRPLPAGELFLCAGASALVAALVGVAIGVCAAVATRHWAAFWGIEARAIAISVIFGLLFFFTGGLTGVYLVPLTMRLSDNLGRYVRPVLFFVAGVLSMAVGLRFYTPVTGLKVQHGLEPAMIIGDGVIVAILGVVIVRFHQLEAEMRQAYEALKAQQQREAELKELATREEIAALQARINPHFLFNTLNSISALIDIDAHQANACTEKLASLFRYTLGASTRATVTLADEWQFLRDYLAIEKIRLGNRLTVEEHLDAELASVPIPGLLLQPLVENAVIHGVASLPSGGRILLRAVKTPEGCAIELVNSPNAPSEARPAQAMRDASHNGYALGNIRQRLALLYAERHSLNLTRTADGGMHVRLLLEAALAPPADALRNDR